MMEELSYHLDQIVNMLEDLMVEIADMNQECWERLGGICEEWAGDWGIMSVGVQTVDRE